MSTLAAARADNFYYPPEWTPDKGGISKFAGSKGKNQYEQYGIIRFELPFDGWCLKCDQHLGKGLRFNAKKGKEGKYFTTQIYRFEMKCITCSNPIIIKTDPKNNTYDYHTGIRKMEHDYDPDEDEQAIVLGNEKEEQTLEEKNNPILKLQNNMINEIKVLTKSERMNALQEVRDQLALHDADNNAKLRKINRERKRSIQEMHDEGEKIGLQGIALLKHNDEDQMKAKMVKYQSEDSKLKLGSSVSRANIMSQSIFGSDTAKSSEKTGSGSNRKESKESAAIRKERESYVKKVQMGINTDKFKIKGAVVDHPSAFPFIVKR